MSERKTRIEISPTGRTSSYFNSIIIVNSQFYSRVIYARYFLNAQVDLVLLYFSKQENFIKKDFTNPVLRLPMFNARKAAELAKTKSNRIDYLEVETINNRFIDDSLNFAQSQKYDIHQRYVREEPFFIFIQSTDKLNPSISMVINTTHFVKTYLKKNKI